VAEDHTFWACGAPKPAGKVEYEPTLGDGDWESAGAPKP